MLKYVFNKNGVCINPTVPFNLKDESCRLEISIAQKDGKWGFGLNVGIQFGNHSGTSWGVHDDRCTFNTEKEALLAATEEAHLIIKKKKSDQEPQHVSKFSCFSLFYQYYESIRQLSIF